jgi:hypothetical protein
MLFLISDVIIHIINGGMRYTKTTLSNAIYMHPRVGINPDPRERQPEQHNRFNDLIINHFHIIKSNQVLNYIFTNDTKFIVLLKMFYIFDNNCRIFLLIVKIKKKKI